jgi:transposase
MPQFSGWCDICQDFYPISDEEWATQFADAIVEILAIYSEHPRKPSVQLCPKCKAKTTEVSLKNGNH